MDSGRNSQSASADGMLRSYLVFHTLTPGSQRARFHARRAPALPLERGQADAFAAEHAKKHGTYRGHAYHAAYSAEDAIDAYKILYAEFIP